MYQVDLFGLTLSNKMGHHTKSLLVWSSFTLQPSTFIRETDIEKSNLVNDRLVSIRGTRQKAKQLPSDVINALPS